MSVHDLGTDHKKWDCENLAKSSAQYDVVEVEMRGSLAKRVVYYMRSNVPCPLVLQRCRIEIVGNTRVVYAYPGLPYTP